MGCSGSKSQQAADVPTPLGAPSPGRGHRKNFAKNSQRNSCWHISSFKSSISGAYKPVICVVIDSGTRTVKAGFSGDEAPKTTFACLVAHPKKKFGKNYSKNILVGQQAEEKFGVLDVKHPIERGIVSNWDDLERIWHHTFYEELKVSPDEQPVYLTEVPMNPKAHRERMTKIMFEKFNVPKLYMNTTAALALFAHGRTTGCVLESGEGVTHVVPIFEGIVLVNAIARLNLGGKVLTDYLQKILHEGGITLQDHEETKANKKEVTRTTKPVHLQVRSIMESLCYVALDYNKENNMAIHNASKIQRKFKLPNGKTITIGAERFYLPELLFEPSFAKLQEDSIVDATFKAIMKCDEFMHEEMLSNVVISGGCTMFPGFRERLTKELQALAPVTFLVNVLSLPDQQQKNTAWVGASLVATMEEFQSMWITRQEYDKTGPSIVHTKCF